MQRNLFFCYNIIVSRERVQEIVRLNIKGVCMSQNKQDKGFRFSIRKRSVGVCGVCHCNIFC